MSPTLENRAPSDGTAPAEHLKTLATEGISRLSWYHLPLALAAYYVVSSLVAWWRLRKFPGPRLASFSTLWLAKTCLSGRAHAIHQADRKKYNSSLIRIAPDILITDDPAIHRYMNSAQSGYLKAPWYNSLRTDAFTHSMFSSRDVAFHDDVKGKVLPGYTGRDVPQMEEEIDIGIGSLKALIRREYLSEPGKTKAVDFSNVPTYFALDSLSKMAFGEPFGYLTAGTDIGGWIKSQHQNMKMMVLAADLEWLGRILFSDTILKMIGPKPTDNNAIGRMMA